MKFKLCNHISIITILSILIEIFIFNRNYFISLSKQIQPIDFFMYYGSSVDFTHDSDIVFIHNDDPTIRYTEFSGPVEDLYFNSKIVSSDKTNFNILVTITYHDGSSNTYVHYWDTLDPSTYYLMFKNTNISEVKLNLKEMTNTVFNDTQVEFNVDVPLHINPMNIVKSFILLSLMDYILYCFIAKVVKHD